MASKRRIMGPWAAMLATAIVGACASPEAPYPVLADLPVPPPSRLSTIDWQALQAEILATGATNREAGRMVQNAEELVRPLPK